MRDLVVLHRAERRLALQALKAAPHTTSRKLVVSERSLRDEYLENESTIASDALIRWFAFMARSFMVPFRVFDFSAIKPVHGLSDVHAGIRLKNVKLSYAWNELSSEHGYATSSVDALAAAKDSAYVPESTDAIIITNNHASVTSNEVMNGAEENLAGSGSENSERPSVIGGSEIHTENALLSQQNFVPDARETTACDTTSKRDDTVSYSRNNNASSSRANSETKIPNFEADTCHISDDHKSEAPSTCQEKKITPYISENREETELLLNVLGEHRQEQRHAISDIAKNPVEILTPQIEDHQSQADSYPENVRSVEPNLEAGPIMHERSILCDSTSRTERSLDISSKTSEKVQALVASLSESVKRIYPNGLPDGKIEHVPRSASESLENRTLHGAYSPQGDENGCSRIGEETNTRTREENQEENRKDAPVAIATNFTCDKIDRVSVTPNALVVEAKRGPLFGSAKLANAKTNAESHSGLPCYGNALGDARSCTKEPASKDESLKIIPREQSSVKAQDSLGVMLNSEQDSSSGMVPCAGSSPGTSSCQNAPVDLNVPLRSADKIDNAEAKIVQALAESSLESNARSNLPTRRPVEHDNMHHVDSRPISKSEDDTGDQHKEIIAVQNGKGHTRHVAFSTSNKHPEERGEGREQKVVIHGDHSNACHEGSLSGSRASGFDTNETSVLSRVSEVLQFGSLLILDGIEEKKIRSQAVLDSKGDSLAHVSEHHLIDKRASKDQMLPASASLVNDAEDDSALKGKETRYPHSSMDQIEVADLAQADLQSNGTHKNSSPSPENAIFIGNISLPVSSENLYNLFKQHGKISHCFLTPHKSNGERNCRAKIIYATAEEAFAALKQPCAYNVLGNDARVTPFDTDFDRILVSEILPDGPAFDESTNVFIDRIQRKSCTEDYIRSLCSSFGNIRSIRISRYPDKTPKCSAHANFETRDMALKCITELNGRVVDDRPLFAALAKKKKRKRQP